MKDELTREFRIRFGRDPDKIFFCPGRVNLIGEHIDYNGGRVMPCAIDMGTWLAVARNTDKRLRFQSLSFPEVVELHLQESYSRTGPDWYNYPLGVLNQLLEDGHVISGYDMLFAGNLPVGAGLASSASIEVLTAFAIDDIAGAGLSRKEIARLAQRSENNFIGIQCGIMDPFVVALAQKDHAMLLDCDTLDYEQLPLPLEDHVLVIINTRKARHLANSGYNTRFVECGRALAALKRELKVQHLCEIAPDEFLRHRHLIGDPVLEKRAMHVIFENQRVIQAAAALKAGDLPAFGKAMFASHQSLEELYEVSTVELDTIVAFSREFDGCIGARMTGAGFGGCAIALVKRGRADAYAVGLASHYSAAIGYTPDVFATTIPDGVTEIIS